MANAEMNNCKYLTAYRTAKRMIDTLASGYVFDVCGYLIHAGVLLTTDTLRVIFGSFFTLVSKLIGNSSVTDWS